MTDAPTIKYFGWSSFTVQTDQGKLAFDPLFRRYCDAKFAELDDFADADVICLTHGHQEHYFDVPKVAKTSKAKVVAPHAICNHLRRFYGVDGRQMMPCPNFETVEVKGFRITSFPWRHRDISPTKAIFRPKIHEGIRWAWNALIRVPFYAPFTGYHIQLPNGCRVLNYNEGFNTNLDTNELNDVAKRFETDVLLAGTQLHFTDEVGEGVAAFSPKKAVLYHPHKMLFEAIKVTSASFDTFAAAIHKKKSNIEILDAQPGWSMVLNRTVVTRIDG
jgi:hypothetical protein